MCVFKGIINQKRKNEKNRQRIMESKKIHIGETISQKLKEEGRTITWLANKTNMDYSALCKALKKAQMNTELLEKISGAMNCNFFNCYRGIVSENDKE